MAVRTDSPILIIGTERSGSNLLRLILNAHPHIAIPHPPHLMRFLGPLAAGYGDLADPTARRRLARDAQLLVRRHIHPWEYHVDPAQVAAEAGPSVFGVVSAMYEQYRRLAGKPRWGCKSTFMVHHVETVLTEYPQARFLWLVRDPRDVAASAKRSVFGHFHPYLTARLWNSQQAAGLAARSRWGSGVVHLLRYEDLVSAPTETLHQVCDFLGEKLEPRMLLHHRSPAASTTASLSESWRNTGRAINGDSVGRHVDGLTAAERTAVELAAADMMVRLGYRPTEPRPNRAPWMPEVYARDFMLRLRVEARSWRRDGNFRQRLVRDGTVHWLRFRAVLRGGRSVLGARAPSTAPGGWT